MSNSETVVGEMLGQFHMACPIRDAEGFSRSVMDLNIGPSDVLNKLEKIDLLRMLKIQQDSFLYMAAEAQGQTSAVLGTVTAAVRTFSKDFALFEVWLQR